ncbi:MAG: hypothetical protein RKR03_14495 [Candidatus Competibacter sp.]|nr:hypothetical protein [Candidatus Competibacter sp.]
MHPSDHSLRQIDDAYLRSLEPEALCGLSVRLLADLKEARGRQRGHSPWPYIAAAIADRRAGSPLAPLPQPGG